MSDIKTSKVLWWLGFLIALLTIILANALQWIDADDYNKLLSIIPYKWQLTIWLLIIILMLIALFYNKAFPKPLNKYPGKIISTIQQEPAKMHPSEIHKRLNGLSQKEKELLQEFVQKDTRTLKLSLHDPIADGLRSNGVLEMTSLVSSPKGISYTINPIYWDYIKSKPSVIGL